MKAVVAIAMISMMGWCDSLGDGCVPMIPGGDDGASGGGSTAAGSTDGAATQASTSAAPTGGGATDGGTGTSQGAGDTTVSAVDTTSAAAETTTGATDGTGVSTGTASSGAETTGAPPVCGDGEVEAPEECDTDTDPDSGVLECDADCKAVRAVDLAAGAAHACVLLSDGRVRCWGDNTHGQRGAMNELEDVRLDENTLLIAGDGASDFSKDVRVDTGNGRIFAGGATTCVTTAIAQETWCWGLGFGGEQPQSTSGEYSAIAIGDVVDPVTKDWWMCGLEWKDPKHVLRCWGSLDDLNKPLFEQLGNANTCFNAVDEDEAGTRLVELAGEVPKLDLGRELGCGPTGAAMLCAGNDGELCDGNPNYNPCVSNSFKPCPASCKLNDCNKSAADVGTWDRKTCYIDRDSPALVNCYVPTPTQPTSLATLCAPAEDFAARHIAVSQDFWCALDPDQPAGSQLCCKAFDGTPGGLVDLTGLPASVLKIVAEEDDILLLDQLGRVIRVAPGAETWESQQTL